MRGAYATAVQVDTVAFCLLGYGHGMDFRSQLDHLEALLAADDTRAARSALAELFGALRAASPAKRDAAVEAVVARVGHEDPHVGAHFALLGGALLEAGAPPRPLARAICEPLRRALVASSRFMALARQLAVLAEQSHRDSTAGMIEGAPIVTISLGATRTFRLRRWKGEDKFDLVASSGSVIVIPYATNLAWTHEVPHFTRDRGRRISITIRAFDS